MPVQWTDELATGLERIDAQHKALYAQVAALHEAMREHRLERIPEVLDGVQRYALEHFADEEREMAARSYPSLAQHRVLHRAFVDEFLRHRALLSASVTLSGVVGLSVWLTDWLRDHVRREDGQFAEWLRAKR